MTTALAFAIPAVACVVFALGLVFGRTIRRDADYETGNRDGYSEGYAQGRHDAEMDAEQWDEYRAVTEL